MGLSIFELTLLFYSGLLPIRLWKCFDCGISDPLKKAEDYANRICAGDTMEKKVSGGCTVACKTTNGNTNFKLMPDGAACGSQSDPSYCYQGACMKIGGRIRDTAVVDIIREKAECDVAKTERGKYWDKFDK